MTRNILIIYTSITTKAACPDPVWKLVNVYVSTKGCGIYVAIMDVAEYTLYGMCVTITNVEEL